MSQSVSPPQAPLGHVRELIALVDARLLPLGLLRAGDANRWTGEAFGRPSEVIVMLDRQTKHLSADLRMRETLGARVRVNVRCAVRARLYFVPSGFADAWLVRLLYRLRRFTVSVGPMPWLRSVTDAPELAERFVRDPGAVDLLQALIGTEPDGRAASASAYVDNGRLWASSARLHGDSAAVFDAGGQLTTAAALATQVERLAVRTRRNG